MDTKAPTEAPLEFPGRKFQLQDLQQIDTKRIIDSLCAHSSFRVKEGYEMKNLPKFDDLTRYNVREDEEYQLWKLEVERLANSARSDTLPTLEGDPDWFGTTDSEGYNRLNRLARQIQYSIDISIHDNELILLENYPQLASEDMYKAVHTKINGVFDEEQGTIRYERPIRIEQFNDEALHALVNYVTAVLIRLVSQRPDSQGFAQASQSNASGNDDGPLAKQQKVLQEDVDTSGARYFMEMDAFRSGMYSLVQTILGDLIWNEEYAETADMFETSSIIYDTGFRDKRTHLCHERDGSIGAATERRATDFAGLAFQVGAEIWNTLPSDGEKTDNSTTLVWGQTPLYDTCPGQEGSRKPNESELYLTAMMDVIKGLVPFLMYCGSFASQLSIFTELVNLLSDPSAPVQYYEQKRILAVAKFNTSAYEKNIISKQTPAVQTVFQTDMARGARRGMPIRQLQDKVEEVERWIIDEKSIIIDHTWYSTRRQE
ncbi:hypothetical protein MKX07_006632 [Trichoderma sp. CBMAI-0711]|nr:hypothetical protein MKX07_006632 [Trichoderma sp. CBMAI-0711]